MTHEDDSFYESLLPFPDPLPFLLIICFFLLDAQTLERFVVVKREKDQKQEKTDSESNLDCHPPSILVLLRSESGLRSEDPRRRRERGQRRLRGRSG